MPKSGSGSYFMRAVCRQESNKGSGCGFRFVNTVGRNELHPKLGAARRSAAAAMLVAVKSRLTVEDRP